MNITKSQLQKIISEEVRNFVKSKLMNESREEKTVKATPDMLQKIIAEEVSKVKAYRLNENAELKRLANSSDVKERCKAAEDPALPEDLVHMLADDPDKEVRDCIGNRKNLPVAIRKKLGLELKESKNLVKATPDLLRRIIAEEKAKLS